MTAAALKEDLQYLAKQGGLTDPGLDKHISFCTNTGLGDFWNSYPWSWASRPHELSITSKLEDYVLPNDFAGVRTVREKSSAHGGVITFKKKETFDREYPHTTSFNVGYPLIYTVYYDNKNQKWFMKFASIPENGYTIYLDMYTTKSTIESVPPGAESGLYASIEKYLYKLGTAARQAAQQYYLTETKRLQRADGPFKGHISEVLRADIRILETDGIRAWFG